MYVKVKELPEVIQSALKTVGYGKVDICVSVKEKESIFFAGGAGYRGFAVLLNMGTGDRKDRYGSWGGANPFVSNQVDSNDQEYVIPENFCVLTGFSGGTSGTVHCSLTLSPKNVLPCLKAAEELGEEDVRILGIMKAYTPAYRKSFLAGKEKMIDSLVERGYIKRNKIGSLSLTTEGKSAAMKSKNH